ncbi:MAG: hypothetical protein ABS917_11175 [Solibacillus sp.]|uniref:hypothetical protein n=1 Tax=Solibacillus sp. TaxID=1909654 RepID=UPI0033149190
MDFKTWLKRELSNATLSLAKEKSALKDLNKEKKRLEKEKADISHLPIRKVETRITNLKEFIDQLKKVQKVEVVRLQTGKVIALSTLKAFNKKVSSRMWTTEITQHPDGLKMTYSDGSSKGQITITGFGVDLEIPEEVELPIFTEGEVLECLIRS